jgi:hemoglobin
MPSDALIIADAMQAIRELQDAMVGTRKQILIMEKAVDQATFSMLVAAADGLLEPKEFNALGGLPMVRSAVRVLYDKVMTDPQLKPYFKGADLLSIRQRQVNMFLALLGAKDYKGIDLELVHAHLDIKGEHFDKLLHHLSVTLEELGLPFDINEAVVDKFRAYRPVIVEVP